MLSTTEDPYEWLRAYADALGETQRTGIANDVVQAVLRGVPELADPDLSTDLSDLAGDCLRSLLAIASLPRESWVDPGLPVAGADLCRTLARRGVDVGVVFKLFRTGHTHFWDSIMDLAEARIADAGLRMRVLHVAWERLSRWMDSTIDGLVQVYQDERDRWLRGALARRAEVVKTILEGHDIDLAHAETILGHNLRYYQTAFTVRATERESPGSELDLEGLAGDLAAALGGARAFTVPSGANGLWGWVASPQPPDRSALAGWPSRHLAALVAVGRSIPGVEGFRRSHRDAVAAQRAAVTLRSPATLTRYEDVELVSLLSTDPETMRAFVADELGELAAPGPRHQRLRETGLAFLQSNANATATAGLLGVHRNTVHNRVTRIEEILRRPLDPSRVQLQLALLLAVHVDPDRLRS
jgi:DNA-binding PucR family transcriptional regulator